MRHHVDKRKLGMKTPHRRAVLANLASSLIMHERIETTLPRAKELRRIADRLITLGKRQTLDARRRAVSMIRNKDAVAQLFSELCKRFEGRNGGYTRIMKLGFRHGDNAPMAIIEYLPKAGSVSDEAKGSKKSKAKAKPAKKPVKAAEEKAAKTVEKKAKARSEKKEKPAKKAAKSSKEKKAKK